MQRQERRRVLLDLVQQRRQVAFPTPGCGFEEVVDADQQFLAVHLALVAVHRAASASPVAGDDLGDVAPELHGLAGGDAYHHVLVLGQLLRIHLLAPARQQMIQVVAEQLQVRGRVALRDVAGNHRGIQRDPSLHRLDGDQGQRFPDARQQRGERRVAAGVRDPTEPAQHRARHRDGEIRLAERGAELRVRQPDDLVGGGLQLAEVDHGHLVQQLRGLRVFQHLRGTHDLLELLLPLGEQHLPGHHRAQILRTPHDRNGEIHQARMATVNDRTSLDGALQPAVSVAAVTLGADRGIATQVLTQGAEPRRLRDGTAHGVDGDHRQPGGGGEVVLDALQLLDVDEVAQVEGGGRVASGGVHDEVRHSTS